MGWLSSARSTAGAGVPVPRSWATGDLGLLRRYEKARQGDILSMQLTTDTLKHLFVNDNPLDQAWERMVTGVAHGLQTRWRALIRR